MGHVSIINNFVYVPLTSEAAVRRCSVKKTVQKNLVCNFTKKIIWHRQLQVNFERFVRTVFCFEKFNFVVFFCIISRNNHWKCSVKKAVLKNFANFTGKHLFWSLFLIKLHLTLMLKARKTSPKSRPNII